MAVEAVAAFCGVLCRLLRGSCACRTAPARRAGLASSIMPEGGLFGRHERADDSHQKAVRLGDHFRNVRMLSDGV